MADLQVSIMAPAKVVVRTSATRVQVPGLLGYLGVLPGHARLVSELGVGSLEVATQDGGDQKFFVSGGYLDVADDKVTLLVDVIERPTEIDRARAEKAFKRASDRLASRDANLDVARAQAALRRANARLAIAVAKTMH